MRRASIRLWAAAESPPATDRCFRPPWRQLDCPVTYGWLHQPRRQTLGFLLALATIVAPTHAEPAGPHPQRPVADARISAPWDNSQIVITTTQRLAGAIDSITWNGKEFINSADHGRQLQSASNFEIDGVFHPETFNPTEAGSRADGASSSSTSQLLFLLARGRQLQTISQMAFWLRPGERSEGHLATNTTDLSNHTLTKRVTIGYRDLPNVIQYDVVFGLPIDEAHRFAQFEALTGYMPPEFSRFLTWNPDTTTTHPLSDGPGEQPLPIVFSTASGSHAMAIYAPLQGTPTPPAFGRWNYPAARVVKWNCVFRYRSQTQLPSRDYPFQCFVVIGSLESVTTSLARLHAQFSN